MTSVLFTSIARGLATIVLAVLAIGVSGCTSSDQSASLFRPAQQTGVAPAQVTYTFQTIDDTGNDNRVTGIDNAGEIVGVYGDSSSNYNSFNSAPPYGSFTPDNLPDATDGTYMNSIASAATMTYQAGYVYAPHSETGIWGVINDNGTWSLLQKHSGEGKTCIVMELMGVNESGYAVGYYENASGNKCLIQAFEMQPGEVYKDLIGAPGTSPIATGINNSGDIVGDTTVSGIAEGWYKVKGATAVPFTYPGSVGTQALSINASDQIVGSYQDSDGNTHGYLLSNPGPSETWQNIDDKHNGLTVVNGINDNGYLCGWYKGADNDLHGFVATPGTTPKRR